MKKNILAFSILALALTSCGNETSGGNKNIIPTDSSESTGSAQSPAAVEFTKELQWTAFKTEEKIGVNGTFKTITLSNTKEAESITESLEGAAFSCDISTLSTGDTSRDGTLNTFFFKNLSTPQITGSFGKFENNKVPVTITLNEKTVTKDFSYAVQGKEVTIKGAIDIIKDFEANKAFESLHKACYDLHVGKTWTEVDLTAKISK